MADSALELAARARMLEQAANQPGTPPPFHDYDFMASHTPSLDMQRVIRGFDHDGNMQPSWEAAPGSPGSSSMAAHHYADRGPEAYAQAPSTWGDYIPKPATFARDASYTTGVNMDRQAQTDAINQRQAGDYRRAQNAIDVTGDGSGQAPLQTSTLSPEQKDHLSRTQASVDGSVVPNLMDPAKMVPSLLHSAYSGFTFPGDVLSGKQPLREVGPDGNERFSQEAINRALDTTLFAATGGGAAVRAGERAGSRPQIARELLPADPAAGLMPPQTFRAYHGTGADFEKFNGSEVWAASDPNFASKFADLGSAHGTGARIMPLDIEAKRPYTMNSALGDAGNADAIERLNPDVIVHNGRDIGIGDRYQTRERGTVKSATTGETLFSNASEKPALAGMAGRDAVRSTHEFPGYGSDDWHLNREYNVNGSQIKGTEEFLQGLRKIYEKSAGPLGVSANRDANLVLGPPGAGKSHFINPLTKFTRSAEISADIPKFMLPEFKTLGASGVHEESAGLARRVQDMIRNDGGNFTAEKLGNNPESISDLARGIRDDGYKVRVASVSAPKDVLMERIKQRFAKTGRDVQESVVDTTLDGLPRTIEALKDNGFHDIMSVDARARIPHIDSGSRVFGDDFEQFLRQYAVQEHFRKSGMVSGGGGKARQGGGGASSPEAFGRTAEASGPIPSAQKGLAGLFANSDSKAAPALASQRNTSNGDLISVLKRLGLKH